MDLHNLPGQEMAGFLYRTPDNWAIPGYGELDINLYGDAADAFFNTRSARFSVVGPEGDIEHVTITHPWSGPRLFHLSPGRIWLFDHASHVVAAFTWGGRVKILPHHDFTRGIVTSPAPIYDLDRLHPATLMLVAEFEALLARCRAQWVTDDVGFERRLASIEPYTLFVSSLKAIDAQLDEVLEDSENGAEDPLTVETFQLVDHMLNAIQEQPDTTPALRTLLSANTHAS
jgi:hypothetical protein